MCKKKINVQKENPIEDLISKCLEKIKNVIDVNTVIGSPIENEFGAVILPISKVSMGLVTGGGQYSNRKKQSTFPFAGGSGAGVSVNPIGFLTIINGVPNFIRIENRTGFDKIGDLLPEILEKLSNGGKNQ